MFSDWYVLQVTTGKEQFIKEKIEKYASPPIQMTIFKREIIHSRQNKKVKKFGPLFSGYIFVYQSIKEACKIANLYLSKEFISPISINNKPCKVYKEEIELLLRSANENGTFQLSRGIKVGERIEITAGPLKILQGNILWIDQKKSKAKVEIFLFKRKMRINLGIEVIQKQYINTN
ncbi:MAG: hypothetical protein JXB88_04060 [Spirochaetales bacterium]|nr:hypothetical protein [Spirochaetales bacterium]